MQQSEWCLLVFAVALVEFHVSEFVLACVYMRDELGWHSWLISQPYLVAMTVAVAEFMAEWYFVPSIKQHVWVSWLGLCLLVFGEILRKCAMVTAGVAFTHRLKLSHRSEHKLVTHGVYRWVRHPGYLGWWLWAVGTQVLLANPLATLAFAIVAARFFRHRVAVEEAALCRFFGEQYRQYASATPTYIPFVP
ncbi:Isoprenylcysteine carboxyl methyltransferase family-domain-containing protein [Haematococcus lacustris]